VRRRGRAAELSTSLRPSVPLSLCPYVFPFPCPPVPLPHSLTPCPILLLDLVSISFRQPEPRLTFAPRSYATPPMLLAMSVKAGFVYGAFSVPVCVLMWLYLPETKG
jgi:hypothetical protein